MCGFYWELEVHFRKRTKCFSGTFSPSLHPSNFNMQKVKDREVQVSHSGCQGNSQREQWPRLGADGQGLGTLELRQRPGHPLIAEMRQPVGDLGNQEARGP